MTGNFKLLPRSYKEFSSNRYWEEFFEKRSEKTFEWYGDYSQLSGVLNKYVRSADKILIIGCGNSNLGADLYDSGCHEITNIDLSENVIKEMCKKHNELRPGLNYLQMDMMETTFEPEKFSVVLDKGTLDALMTDGSEEILTNVKKLFAEVSRLLRNGGRYICVSLLQEHILNTLVSHFSAEGWLVRICQLNISKEKSTDFYLPVFVVVLTKFIKRNDAKPILEFVDISGINTRVDSIDELNLNVRNGQYYAWLMNKLKTCVQLEEQYTLELWDASSAVTPRYTLHIVSCDHSPPDKKFAVFIVPEGRETEWLFSSDEGRQQLAKSASYGRLVVVTLSRDHVYHDLDEVKSELSPKVLQLAPPTRSKQQFPFLSLGDDISNRRIRHRGHSQLSGDYVIEDVSVDGQLLRRLIFLSNKNVVQSEVALQTANKTRRKKSNKDSAAAPSIDHSFLSFPYYSAVIAGLALLPEFSQRLANDLELLLIGLGGGTLAMFLHNTFTKMKVTAVDLDTEVVQIATDWFGLVRDDRMTVCVDDGLQHLQRVALTDKKFDVIIVDVDAKDLSIGISCPPTAFLETDWLNSVRSTLKPSGLYVVNLVCRNTTLRQQALANIKKHFHHVTSIKLTDAVNEVVFARQQVVQAAILLDDTSKSAISSDDASQPAVLLETNSQSLSKELNTFLTKCGLTSKLVDQICNRFSDLSVL